MGQYQQYNPPKEVVAARAAEAYREVLRGRKDNPSTDDRFRKLGVDVDKEKKRFGVPPYKPVHVSDELEKRITEDKAKKIEEWKQLDKIDGKAPRSVELAREKYLLERYYVKGETEEQYYDRWAKIKELKKEIQSAQAVEAKEILADGSDTSNAINKLNLKIAESKAKYSETPEQRRENARIALSAASSRFWGEAQNQNHQQAMKQIEKIAHDPGREYSKQTMEAAGYQEGVGIDTSKTAESARSREFGILNAGMAKRFGPGSPSATFAADFEATKNDPNVYWVSQGYGKLPVKMHKRTESERIAFNEQRMVQEAESLERAAKRGTNFGTIGLRYHIPDPTETSGYRSVRILEYAKYRQDSTQDPNEKEIWQGRIDEIENHYRDKGIKTKPSKPTIPINKTPAPPPETRVIPPASTSSTTQTKSASTEVASSNVDASQVTVANLANFGASLISSFGELRLPPKTELSTQQVTPTKAGEYTFASLERRENFDNVSYYDEFQKSLNAKSEFSYSRTEPSLSELESMKATMEGIKASGNFAKEYQTFLDHLNEKIEMSRAKSDYSMA